MSTYNGHSSHAAWNVSLWINNDEGLYRLAQQHVRRNNRTEAAKAMLEDLKEMGLTHTPDGSRYTVSSIKSAMVGL